MIKAFKGLYLKTKRFWNKLLVLWGDRWIFATVSQIFNMNFFQSFPKEKVIIIENGECSCQK